MKRFVSWAVSAGLVLAASAAHAQMPAPYRAVSDFEGPYGTPYGAPPPAAPPVYAPYGGEPGLLAPQQVYGILRDNGFSPLGVPHQRGFVYTIAALDRNGEDGRVLIDARNGRIIRFVPAYGYGPYGQGRYDQGDPERTPYEQGPYNHGAYDQGADDQGPYDQAPYDQRFPMERMWGYGAQGALPPPTMIRGTPRPPASIPHVASRGVPLPAPKPATAGTLPDPTPQATPAQASTSPHPATAAPASVAPGSATVGVAQPAAVIRPTREMPEVQDLE
jgi:hypothetical protein